MLGGPGVGIYLTSGQDRLACFPQIAPPAAGRVAGVDLHFACVQFSGQSGHFRSKSRSKCTRLGVVDPGVSVFERNELQIRRVLG